MGGYLSGKGPYTLFAPTNDAFNKFTPNTINAIFSDRPQVSNILQYHVVPGKLTIADLASISSVRTIDGRTLPVSVQNGYLMVGGARVITRGIDCTNGVIYPVDNVIIPPTSVVAGAPITPAVQTQPAVPQPTVAAPAPRRGISLSGILLLILGVIILGGLFLLWLFMRLVKRIFRGPQRARQPPTRAAYTEPYSGARTEPGQGVYEPATFGAGGGAVKDTGPYLASGGAGAAAEGITFDESAVNEIGQIDRSRLADLHQYIIGSYNSFKDRLDLVRDAHIDLQEIKDNNAVSRFMERYHLSPFNSSTLELALERNATIYTKDRMLLDIYRAAGAKAEDIRRLLAGSSR